MRLSVRKLALLAAIALLVISGLMQLGGNEEAISQGRKSVHGLNGVRVF